MHKATQITCCYKCEKRHKGCHSSCEDYIRQKSEAEEYACKWRKEIINYRDIVDTYAKKMYKGKK